MKAIILAAGEGKRLHPLTLEIPKPLVKVLDKPLIQHAWEVLPDVVDEVIVVVGYKSDLIREFLGEKFLGKRVTYVEQDEPKGTGHAVNLCREYLAREEKFIVMYADDLHDKMAILKCCAYEAALLVSSVEDPRRFGVVVKKDDGTIRDIEEKPTHPRSNLAAVGVYILPFGIFDYDIADQKNGEYYLTDMIAGFVRDNPTHAVESSFWMPIAYPEDIERAEEALLNIQHESNISR
ncbi:MAG: sugar phosphate nucleotidyltransferase [Patescibacteria group bacterium]